MMVCGGDSDYDEHSWENHLELMFDEPFDCSEGN